MKQESGSTGRKKVTRKGIELLLCLVTTACGSPSAPSTEISSADVRRLDVTGPSTLTPTSGTVHYTATATFADGSSQDVSSLSTWRLRYVGSPLPLELGAAGDMRAIGTGEVEVMSTFRGVTASRPVLVMTPGTFKIQGHVTTGDGQFRGQAIVRVVSGAGAGQSTSTRSDGLYTLWGVAGPIVIETESQGYGRQQFNVTANEGTVADLTMAPLVTAADLNGTWRVTLVASETCTAFPATARERVYETTIEQRNGFLTAVFTGPSLIDVRPPTSRGSFTVRDVSFVTTDTFAFWL